MLQRTAKLDTLLAGRPDGIFLSSFEQGEIGPDPFRHACMMGLEGVVSSAAIGLTVAGAPKIGSR